MRQTIRLLFWLALSLGCSPTAKVQAHEPFSYLHYTTSDGLPHMVGYEMLQDRQGYLWIGTDNGLVRFDGGKFETYRMSDGLATPHVITVSEAPDGSIYAGSHWFYLTPLQTPGFRPGKSQESLVYNPKLLFWAKDSAFCIDIHPNQNPGAFSRCYWLEGSLQHDYYVLVESQDERIWEMRRADTTSFIHHLHYLDQSATAWEIEAYPSVRKWFQDRQGQMFLLTGKGLYRYHAGRFRRESASAGFDLYSIYQTQAGDYWAGGVGCLYHGTPDTGLVRIPLPEISEPIIDLKVLSNGKIYFFTQQRDELYVWDVHTKTLSGLSKRLSLRSSLSFLLLDAEEQLWFTTNGDGVYCLYHHDVEAFHPEDREIDGGILAVQQTTDGQIWLASMSRLFRYAGGKLEEVPLRQANSGRSLRFVHMYQQGHRVLLQSTHGLYVFDLNTGDKLLYEDCLGIKIFETKPKGYEIFACKSRVSTKVSTTCYDLSDRHFFEPTPSKDFHFKCYSPGPCGRKWFGAIEGLVRVDGDRLVSYQTEDGLPSAQINDLLLQADTLWIATNQGLAFYHHDSIHTVFEPSLADLPLRQLLLDHRDRLWVGTPSGLYCYAQGRTYGFGTANGLPTNDIHHLMIDQDSLLWISTSQGVSRLDLTQPLPLSLPPRVFFRRIEINGLTAPVMPHQRLSYQDVLLVTFGIVTLKNHDFLSWQYRLEEEADWQTIDARELVLSNLRGGKYQLQVRARMPNSTWSEPLNWPFEVIAPWYRSPGWLGLWGVALLSLLGGGFFLYQRWAMRRQAQQLELDRRLAGLELQALQAQMNPHFLFNALNAIQHFMLSHEVEVANEYLSRFAQLIRQFLEASRQRFHLLSDEITLLQDYLEMEHLCYGEHFSYDIAVSDQASVLNQEFPAMLLQPLVENAIRHGLVPRDSQGHLQVSFSVKADHLCCVIEDNGVGRAYHLHQARPHHHRSRGLHMLSDRIDTLHRSGWGKIHLHFYDRTTSDGTPDGTRVEMLIPLEEA
jgi:ligand-binding sensor domain-containing protein